MACVQSDILLLCEVSHSYLEILISPLWVAAAAGTTYLFGGIAAIPLIKAFAHNKLLRRKIVISDSNKELVKIAAANESVANLADVFSFRAFAITLGLALGLNLM